MGTMGTVGDVFRPPMAGTTCIPPWYERDEREILSKDSATDMQKPEQKICRRAIGTLFGPLFVDDRLDPLE
jgi:hypothetical protein